MLCVQTLINTARIDYTLDGFDLYTATSAAFMKRGNLMSCKPVCRLCDKLVLSQSVTFAGGVLTVNLPAGSYEDGEKYCIVIAQAIPATTIIGAPVVFTIGTGTQTYPLTKCDCAQVTACGIRTRTRYSVVVSTNSTGGVFRMLGRPCCAPNNNLTSINGTAPTA